MKGDSENDIFLVADNENKRLEIGNIMVNFVHDSLKEDIHLKNNLEDKPSFAQDEASSAIIIKMHGVTYAVVDYLVFNSSMHCVLREVSNR